MDNFRKYFGISDAGAYRAPGRVNLIGEHTDYNDGFVLPIAIPQMTSLQIAMREDRTVRVLSRTVSADPPIESFLIGGEERRGRWLDYVQGVTWYLRAHSYPLKGFDVLIDSQVPMGSGLSSSSSLLVALFRALRSQLALPLDDVEIALACQTVENEFVGARVGIMDPMASSLATEDEALFLDTREMTFEKIPIPRDKIDIFVIDSGIQHSHAHGAYNIRRGECEEAARLLGLRSLRDFAEEDSKRLKEIPDLLQRRVRHVLSENDRVLRSVDALRKGEVEEFGQLMIASHHSMRDDFQISTADMDSLVATALHQDDVYGARMTGGGFGGSIVGICRNGQSRRVAESIARRFEGMTQHRPSVLIPR